jgi:hypothetical protein
MDDRGIRFRFAAAVRGCIYILPGLNEPSVPWVLGDISLT